jgi:hypothetical protein
MMTESASKIQLAVSAEVTRLSFPCKAALSNFRASLPRLLPWSGAFCRQARPTGWNIMKMNEELLADVRIASPCNARWEDMDGDERSRFCRHCSKHVYNFSEMTAQDATALIREREGRLCARFYQRTDGTVLTNDCPVGAERPLHWFKQLISAAAACLCLSGSSALAGEKPRASTASQKMLMGDICVQPPASNVVKQAVANTNRPAFMGKICIQPTPPSPPATSPTTTPASGGSK